MFSKILKKKERKKNELCRVCGLICLLHQNIPPRAPTTFLGEDIHVPGQTDGTLSMKAGGEKAQDFPAVGRSPDCVAKVLVLGIGDPSSHTLP